MASSKLKLEPADQRTWNSTMLCRGDRTCATSNPSGVTPSLWNYPAEYRITRAFDLPHGRQPVPSAPHSRPSIYNNLGVCCKQYRMPFF